MKRDEFDKNKSKTNVFVLSKPAKFLFEYKSALELFFGNIFVSALLHPSFYSKQKKASKKLKKGRDISKSFI